MELSLKPSCPKCGPTILVVPDDPKPDDAVTCQSCGEDLCSYAALEDKIEKFRALGREFFRNALKP
jgi:hypothetical protein